MKEIIIIGAGRCGRVLADALIKGGAKPAGFLDEQRTGTLLSDIPVLGGFDAATAYLDCDWVMAEENPQWRLAFMRTYPEKSYLSVVHPGAIIGTEVTIEEGVFIDAGVILGTGVSIGEGASIGMGSVIGADTVISKGCVIGARVSIGAGVTVGENAVIGDSVTLKDGITLSPGTVLQTGEIVVKDMVLKMVYKRGAWIYKESEEPK